MRITSSEVDACVNLETCSPFVSLMYTMLMYIKLNLLFYLPVTPSKGVLHVFTVDLYLFCSE